MSRDTPKLYTLNQGELLNVLRQHGVNASNVSFATRIYESGNQIKAVVDSYKKPPRDQTGQGESIGFWTWISGWEYIRINQEQGLDAAAKANLDELKRLL